MIIVLFVSLAQVKFKMNHLMEKQTRATFYSSIHFKLIFIKNRIFEKK